MRRCLSKHYYKDEHFVPLMEKIANEIINRVRQTIDIRTLLSSYTLNEAKNICYQAKQLLLQWKIEYQNTQSKLENDKRNFSTNRLYVTFALEIQIVTGEEQIIDCVLEHVSDFKS
ncbi:unnamed protein product [Rotaria sp. Silwood2]|nr:unnamed protein product [Rotaria sp. Silwood2]